MSLSTSSMLLQVDDPSRVGEVRRAAQAAAGRLGFDATAVGRCTLAATELVTNLVKHAGQGEILLGACEDGGGEPVLQIAALDRGPGMADVAACLRDGYSTAGSPGNGLGAVRRQASAFAVWSRPGAGTVVMAQIGARQPASAWRPPAAAPCWAGIAVPAPGEEVCGDAFAARAGAGSAIDLMLADGLGHGPAAASASAEAVRAFTEAGGTSGPGDILQAIDGGLRHTRGAAVAVARIEGAASAVRIAGIGNIVGVALQPGAGEPKRLVSMPGITGQPGASRRDRRAREFHYTFAVPPVLVLHSDGLSANWSLDAYPGLVLEHPGLVAAVLFRDHVRRDALGRRSDDAAVLVARAPGRAAA